MIKIGGCKSRLLPSPETSLKKEATSSCLAIQSLASFSLIDVSDLTMIITLQLIGQRGHGGYFNTLHCTANPPRDKTKKMKMSAN